MAAKAPVFCNSAMLGLRVSKLLNKLLVTFSAKRGSFILEVIGKLRAMGVVALLARFLYRLMDKFFLKICFLVLMTVKAKCNPFSP